MSYCKTDLTKQELFDVYNKNISNSSWSSVHMSYMNIPLLWWCKCCEESICFALCLWRCRRTQTTLLFQSRMKMSRLVKKLTTTEPSFSTLFFLELFSWRQAPGEKRRLQRNRRWFWEGFKKSIDFSIGSTHSPIHPPLKTIFLKPSLNNVSSSEHQYLFRRLFSTAPSNPTPQVSLKIFKVMATSPTLCSTHPSLSPTSWLRGW